MNSSGSLFTSDQYAYGKQLCCRNCQENYTNNKVQMVNVENMYMKFRWGFPNMPVVLITSLVH